MAWNGEAEDICHGISHQAICPLLKQWRQGAKGKATAESAGLREAMVEYLRAGVYTWLGERGRAQRAAGWRRQGAGAGRQTSRSRRSRWSQAHGYILKILLTHL